MGHPIADANKGGIIIPIIADRKAIKSLMATTDARSFSSSYISVYSADHAVIASVKPKSNKNNIIKPCKKIPIWSVHGTHHKNIKPIVNGTIPITI